MAVVLVDVKEEVDFFFGLCGRRTEASSAANFSFKSGGVDCRIVARSGLYYDIRISSSDRDLYSLLYAHIWSSPFSPASIFPLYNSLSPFYLSFINEI